jgi:hypothetical protein
MSEQKGFIPIWLLILIFIVIIVIVGGLVYLDSTDGWGKFKDQSESNDTAAVNDEAAAETQQQVKFIVYQSPDKLYQLQVPDSWTGEERAGASIFYSYNPAQGQPDQRAKIEIGRMPNPDQLTLAAWSEKEKIDLTSAQQAVFGRVPGAMLLDDNTAAKPNDIKSVIYIPVNNEVLVITAESFGGSRDAAVQFFNVILNSWQWTSEITSPDLLNAPETVSTETQTLEGGDELNPEEPITNEENENVETVPPVEVGNEDSGAEPFVPEEEILQ